MKNAAAWRGTGITVLTVMVLGWWLGIDSVFLMLIVSLVLWFALEIFLENQKSKKQAKHFEKTGIISLSEEEKKEKKELLEMRYNSNCKEAKETAKQRYAIDFGMISHVIDLTKGLALNDVKEGIEMQNSKGPQTDWAIVGGLVSGLAGGAAGMAAAADTMRQNEEATRRYHEQGRRMVEHGIESYNRLEKNKNDILSQEYDDFIYSYPKPELINELKVRVTDTKNYGIGYITANVKIIARRDYIFPEDSDKRAAIDGTVRVDLYDKEGKKLLASGYYCPPNRYGNDLSKTGFGTEGYKEIPLKVEPNVSFNKHEGYQVKLSNPNLWLLQL